MGIDGQGAPHVFDAINNVWAQHGDGIDAVATTPDGTTAYFFMGSEVISLNVSTMQTSVPQFIGSLWPNLPDSFKLGVSGACTGLGSGKSLTLFSGGRYVSTDGALPLSKLTAIPGWPKTANWQDGLFDMIFAGPFEMDWFHVVRNGEYMLVNPEAGQIEAGPAPFSQTDASKAIPASWGARFDCGTAVLIGGTITNWYFRGTSVVTFTNATTQPQYIANISATWPATWHPTLQHAPNGRDGNLWSVLTSAQGSWIVQHNGDTWTKLPNQADHVGVRQDNAVMIASAQKLWKFTGAFDGSGFSPVSPVSNLIQMSLGNANAVFARDTGGNVYRFDPNTGALTPNTDVGTVAHIATSNDGSLWHAKPNDANMHRQLVGSGATPEAIPIKQSLVASVNKVAATGFGSSHCLAQDSQGDTQAYRYDSPYVFKTATQYNVFDQTPAVIEQGAGLLFFTDNVLLSISPDIKTKAQIVALDAHTSVEVARTPRLPDPLDYGQPVFDLIHNLIYVGTASQLESDPKPGQLLALNARTLAVKWSFAAASGIDAPPALDGMRLSVSDRAGNIYLFDTSAALAAAMANPPAAIKPKWVKNVLTQAAQTHRVTTPLFVHDQIYAAVWDADFDSGNWNYQISWVNLGVANGATNGSGLLATGTKGTNLNISLGAPVYARLSTPVIYYNCYFSVVSATVNTNPTPTFGGFFMTNGDYINTGFTYDADTRELWFGTRNGAL